MINKVLINKIIKVISGTMIINVKVQIIYKNLYKEKIIKIYY